MDVLVKVLIWLHVVAFGVGMAGGLGMSKVGPHLIAAPPDGRESLWPMAKAFSGMTAVAMALLLVTGPLILWLKYAGGAGLDGWFMAKMALVLLAVIAFGLGKVGLGRLKRGDEGGGRLMAVAGPMTGLAVLAAVLAAVFAFG